MFEKPKHPQRDIHLTPRPQNLAALEHTASRLPSLSAAGVWGCYSSVGPRRTPAAQIQPISLLLLQAKRGSQGADWLLSSVKAEVTEPSLS